MDGYMKRKIASETYAETGNSSKKKHPISTSKTAQEMENAKKKNSDEHASAVEIKEN